MKITFMGAGSSVFVKKVLGDTLMCECFKDAEIALYDIDGERLEDSYMLIAHLNKVINGNKAKIKKYLGVFGNRRALAEKIKADAKEEKRQRIASQRLLRAVECAKKKGGDCRIADNVRIVCRVCTEFKCCESVQRWLKPSGV